MVEYVVLNYLNDGLSVPACTEIPSDQTEFVLIEKIGGGESDHITTARIALQSYGNTLYRAAEINEEVKAVMSRFPELPTISRSKLDNDYNFTDRAKKRYRYQAIFDVTYNGAVLTGQE